MNTKTGADGARLNLAELWDQCIAIDDAAGPVTADAMRKLFERHEIVKGSMRPPSADGFTHLARCLSAMIGHVRKAEPFKRREDLHRRVGAALDELIEALPELIGIERRASVRLPFDVIANLLPQMIALQGGAAGAVNEILPILPELREIQSQFAKELAETDAELGRDLEALHAAAQTARAHIFPVPSSGTDETTWHPYAIPLAARFREAMHTTNPNLVLRLSDTGPVARFVTAAIPLITNETPDRVAVARHLQRRQRGEETRTRAAVAQLRRLQQSREEVRQQAIEPLLRATRRTTAVATTDQTDAVADS